MIYTKLTVKAMNIAYNAHHGQFDKSGMPYIFHPMHVADELETEEECIVALLHDVVEDTSVTFEDLKKDFSKEIIDALMLLTHDKKVPYMDYIKNIKSNELATKVKLADLEHNSDLKRLEKVTLIDKARQEKYLKAIQYLKS